MKNNSQKQFWIELLRVALPISVQYLISQVLMMIDNIMIGSLHEANITAVTICTTFAWLATTFFMGLGEGMVIICARAFGSGNQDKIKKTYSLVFVVNIVVSIVFFIAVSIFPEQILRLYSNIEAIIEPGVTYFHYSRFLILFSGIATSMSMLFQSVKSVRIGLVSSIVSCIFNVVLNYLLIFGNFGFPALGVKGAAIATMVSKLMELIVVFVYWLLFDRKLAFKPFEIECEKDWSEIKYLINITYPLLVIDVLSQLVSSVQTMITGHISQYYVAANSIVHNSWVLPTIFCYGLSMAAGVMVGNEIGKGNSEDIKEYGRKFLYLSVGLGLFNAAMVQVLLPVISSFYQVQPETLDLARKMGYYASVTTFFNTTSVIVCTGVIKSTGKTRILLILDLVSNWLVAVPFGYLAAFVFKWPAEMLYLILRGGNIVKSIWGFDQILNDKWIRNFDLKA